MATSEEELKKTFPELFDEDGLNEEEKDALRRMREGVKTRFKMDAGEVAKQHDKKKFTSNEYFLYSALLLSATRQDIKLLLLSNVRVDALEDEVEELKKEIELFKKISPSIQKKIKKNK